VKTVSAAEANRNFSKLLSEARAGERIAITSRGKRVAALVPISDVDDEARRERAIEALTTHWANRPAFPAVKWTREELYDDEPLPGEQP
jgi:prevent-host-death family protein